MKKLIILLVMVFVASGVNGQPGPSWVRTNSDFYYPYNETLIDAMLHCNNIKELIDTIRSHGEEVFIVFDGYKTNFSCGTSKLISKKISVEDFLYNRQKYDKYDNCYKPVIYSKFSINGLEIYKDNIYSSGAFEIDKRQNNYMKWLKYHNEREYILKMISEEQRKRLREIREKRLSEIRKEIETSENENIRQWMERNNYTPQTDVFNVKRWDVGAMNDEIEEIRRQLKK